MNIQELEQQIRDLQKELGDVQMEQAALRLQPCKGDSEILAKDVKYDELDRRFTVLPCHLPLSIFVSLAKSIKDLPLYLAVPFFLLSKP
jgi:hypothetical protein